MSVSNEPVVWLPFSGGGMLAALFVPVHILLFGLAIPLGWVADPGPEALAALLDSPLVKLYLVTLVGGCLFHAAHRLRYLVIELGVRVGAGVVAPLWYLAALAGTVWAAVVVF